MLTSNTLFTCEVTQESAFPQPCAFLHPFPIYRLSVESETDRDSLVLSIPPYKSSLLSGPTFCTVCTGTPSPFLRALWRQVSTFCYLSPQFWRVQNAQYRERRADPAAWLAGGYSSCPHWWWEHCWWTGTLCSLGQNEARNPFCSGC